ncbi:MAG: PilZ domain-containing protein [Candidatus Gastranaerophilales bacterium]|nr:PilZ domain-containing protein [Candidatus Gastranaerophilales bacterium]
MNTLLTGQKVQIEFSTSSTEKMQIVCRIAKIEKDRLTLEYPDKIMRFAEFLAEGTEIRAFVYTGSNIQVLDSIIITAPYEEAFEIEYPDDYITIQRRAYVREFLNCKIILQNDTMTTTGVSKDLGGGGFRFISKDKLPNNSYMSVWINLDDDAPSIKCHGKVSQKPHYKKDEYLVEFTEISENDRNRIIKECIRYQVNNLRKNK